MLTSIRSQSRSLGVKRSRNKIPKISFLVSNWVRYRLTPSDLDASSSSLMHKIRKNLSWFHRVISFCFACAFLLLLQRLSSVHLIRWPSSCFHCILLLCLCLTTEMWQRSWYDMRLCTPPVSLNFYISADVLTQTNLSLRTCFFLLFHRLKRKSNWMQISTLF